MSDSRSRYIAWINTQQTRPINTTDWGFEIWQAGLADGRNEAARKCAQVAGPEDSYQDEHFKAKADSVNRIKAEFPEAFPVDPNAWAFDRGLEST